MRRLDNIWLSESSRRYVPNDRHWRVLSASLQWLASKAEEEGLGGPAIVPPESERGSEVEADSELGSEHIRPRDAL